MSSLPLVLHTAHCQLRGFSIKLRIPQLVLFPMIAPLEITISSHLVSLGQHFSNNQVISRGICTSLQKLLLDGKLPHHHPTTVFFHGKWKAAFFWGGPNHLSSPHTHTHTPTVPLLTLPFSANKLTSLHHVISATAMNSSRS